MEVSEVTELVGKPLEDLTEDEFYGKPMLSKEWRDGQRKVDASKGSEKIREGQVQRRREFIKKFFDKGKPSELDRRAMEVARSEIPPDKFIEYLDNSEGLSEPLNIKPALVQIYTDNHNMKVDLRMGLPSQKVDERRLIVKLKEFKQVEQPSKTTEYKRRGVSPRVARVSRKVAA